MAILRNEAFANKNLVTAYGTIHFDENGTVKLEDSIAIKLATLKGFSIDKEDEEVNESEITEDEELDEEYEEEIDEEEDNLISRKELESMTVKQMEKYARENNIELNGATKRAEIISAILGE